MDLNYMKGTMDKWEGLGQYSRGLHLVHHVLPVQTQDNL